MTTDALDLARRAMACPGWRWMPGMLGYDDDDGSAWRCMGDVGLPDGRLRWCGLHGVGCADFGSGITPDLTDPATLGCLLALVREAWGDTGECGRVSVYATRSPTVHALGGNQPWAVCVSPPIIEGRVYHGPTEAAALVAALEAAP